jgi:preprotein translocase subunit SecG
LLENGKIIIYVVIAILCIVGTIVLYRKKQKQSLQDQGTTIEFSSKHTEFIQHAPEKFLKQFTNILENANVIIHKSESDLCVYYEDDPDHETDIVITLCFVVRLPNVDHNEEIKVLCHYLEHIEVLYVKNSSKIPSFNEQEIKQSLYFLGLIEDESM